MHSVHQTQPEWPWHAPMRMAVAHLSAPGTAGWDARPQAAHEDTHLARGNGLTCNFRFRIPADVDGGGHAAAPPTTSLCPPDRHPPPLPLSVCLYRSNSPAGMGRVVHACIHLKLKANKNNQDNDTPSHLRARQKTAIYASPVYVRCVVRRPRPPLGAVAAGGVLYNTLFPPFFFGWVCEASSNFTHGIKK